MSAQANRVGFERRPDFPFYPREPTSGGSVRFLDLEVRSTSDGRRRWARSAKTGFDPSRTLANAGCGIVCGVPSTEPGRMGILC